MVSPTSYKINNINSYLFELRMYIQCSHAMHTHIAPPTLAVVGSREQVEEPGLTGDGPGLEDVGQPKAIALLSLGEGVVQEHVAMEPADISLVQVQGRWGGEHHLLHSLL